MTATTRVIPVCSRSKANGNKTGTHSVEIRKHGDDVE
jgi:hypothetical protein